MWINDYIRLKKEQRIYNREKENKVYMVIVDYKEEMPIRMGVTDIDMPYKRAKQINMDIWARYYEDGRASYITYKKGEFVYAYEKPFKENERIAILYRPHKKDRAQRELVLFSLLSNMKVFIEGRNKLIDEGAQIWGASKEVINEHIRKNNIVLFEIEKMIDTYCFTT